MLVAELSQRGGGLGDLAGREGGDGQRASGDPVVAVAEEQLAQVEPGGGEDVEGQRQQQQDDRGDEEPPGPVGGGQGGTEQRQAIGGDAGDEGDPGRGGLPVPQDRDQQDAQPIAATASRTAAAGR